MAHRWGPGKCYRSLDHIPVRHAVANLAGSDNPVDPRPWCFKAWYNDAITGLQGQLSGLCCEDF